MHALDEHWLGNDPALAWRPRSLPRAKVEWVDRRARMPILAAIALLHVLAGGWLLADRLASPEDADAPSALLVEFITRVRELEVDPAEIIFIRPAATATKAVRRPRSRSPQTMTVVDKAPAEVARAPAPAIVNRLRLFAADGSLLVPDDLLDQIDRRVGDQRDFSYQVPRLDAMEKLLHRVDALPYEATRFEKGWQPDQDMLTELLTKAVEKTTATVKIPVPGQPGAKFVCKVSLLALGGGCGVQHNGDGYQVELNDPDTLNEQEQRQCQAWWDKIIGASSQDVWRKTRALYDLECRKPPERKP